MFSLKMSTKNMTQGFRIQEFNLEIKDKEFIVFLGLFRMRQDDDVENDCRS